ncbi:hypothetical protein K469DRAFT_255800 [Zopfia rhizophila CBS 207.26]|uniref:Uncharacterized protein n=1 Tax=Zopfia rhizophila CBS 207.26 TaxID=1314779 RepID=A0A6A6DU13_9PEZI|nr:hypothetical protein K469DRAFT_255800 [Zopfia rhizophila CBS 207.26]
MLAHAMGLRNTAKRKSLTLWAIYISDSNIRLSITLLGTIADAASSTDAKIRRPIPESL